MQLATRERYRLSQRLSMQNLQYAKQPRALSTSIRLKRLLIQCGQTALFKHVHLRRSRLLHFLPGAKTSVDEFDQR